MFFQADGRFFDDKPLWHADGSVDFEGSTMKAPTRVGRYRIEGTQLILTWNDSGKERRLEIDRTSSGEPVFDFGEYFRPATPCAFSAFSGRYWWGQSVDLPPSPTPVPGMAGAGVSISNGTGLTMERDGRLVYENYSSLATTGVVGTTSGPVLVDADSDNENTKEAGSYEIGSLFLTVKLANGKKVRDVLQCYDSNEGVIVWGYRVFRRTN